MQKQYSVFGATNTMSYYYNGSVLIGMETEQGAIMRFSYDAGGNVGSVDYSDDYGDMFTTYYYLRNAQGDIVKLIDGSGNTVVEYTYDSWGRIIATTGSLANTVGADQPFRYRRYVYDTETEWYYLQSRYYDPTTCRFISADIYLSTGQGIIGHNSYAYCLNSVVNGVDPSGHAFFSCFVVMSDGGGNLKNSTKPTRTISAKTKSRLIRKIASKRFKKAKFTLHIHSNQGDKSNVCDGGEDLFGGIYGGCSSTYSNGYQSISSGKNIDLYPSYNGFSTGRTEAENLWEQLSMESVKSNPYAGRIIQRNLGDPRLPAGTVKCAQGCSWYGFNIDLQHTNIHYLYNVRIGFFDFKFKDADR